jgi:hypothetical protein
MELVGDEKKIRALFSELRFADEQTLPQFAAVWSRAEARTVRTARAFNLSFVAATALLVCALVSLAWWSRHWEGRQPNVVATSIPAAVVVPASKTSESNLPASDAARGHLSSKTRAMKLAALRQARLLAAGRKATRDAQAISIWQSPTSALLKSQNDELLKSLPQLSESADELKSFLPNTPN